MRLLKSTLMIVFVMIAFSASAQTPNKYTVKGNIAFEKRYWYAAISDYKVALRKEKDPELKKLMTYRIAQSYEKTRDWKNAVSWYKKVIKKSGKFLDAHPEAYLKLANSLKKMEMYEEAMEQYMEYQSLVPGDDKGIKGTKSCELAMKWLANPTRYKVENVKQLNTKYDDAIPAYASKKKNEIVFQSYREGGVGSGENDVSGQAFPDLYSTKVDRKTGQWAEPVILPEPVNSKFAEGAPAFNKKFNTIYFTRCENNEKEVKGCDLYMATKKGQGYAPEVKLEIFDDSSATVNFHGFLTQDDQHLYFVSNMKGGQGGYDIWVAEWDKKEKKFINPRNLGPGINTDGDEFYPYLHEDGTLYFSSDGHIGMGGFDLFKAEKEGKAFGPVVNLKYPLNSSGDDVSIVFDGEFERGFISSNRAGSKGRVDIWSFVLPKAEVFVEGIVSECNSLPIANAKVLLKGSDNSTQEFVTGSDGKYKFKLNLGMTYSLVASSDSTYVNSIGTTFDRYFAAKPVIVDVVGVEDSKVFIQDVCLEKIPEKGIELPNIVYEYNSAKLTADAKNKLGELIATMNENPKLVIELGSHTDYRGGDAYNKKLAQARAESAVKFLIESGIDAARMEAHGYGEEVPKTIDSTVFSKITPAQQAMFPIGTVLTEAYIAPLKGKDNNKFEVANQMNRRTEFKVLRTDYQAGQPAKAGEEAESAK